MINIRQATPGDAPGIAALQALCWPDQPADPARVAGTLAEPDHATTVIVQDGLLAGFVDSFVTLGAQGARRWEIDLLAVHPDCRGQGMGRILIGANFGAGRRFAPQHARALIRLDNIASQRVFASAGFARAPETCRLVIATYGPDRALIPPEGAHLIPVQTLTYRGIWVEGTLASGAFAAAQDVRARYGWEVAGCVVPLAEAAALEAAQDAGYAPAGEYAWWVRPYP
ncbi:MAG: GNAT family N-acetyltransferase [Anaerolineae bacterium]|nr:GNAT family N-acetyltransferase [Anaerolineae bacterium]